MKVKPNKPSLMVLLPLFHAQGGDVGAGAEWDSPATVWHEFPHALCPTLPKVGQLQHDTFGIPPVGAGTGAPHCQNAAESLIQVQWKAQGGMSWERNNSNGNSDKLQF